MKRITLLMLFALILFSSFSEQKQTNYKVIKITAIKLNDARIATFAKIPDIKAFTVDKNGILRAAKDYQIIYETTEKKIVIIPVKTTYKVFKQNNDYDEIELPNGDLVVCMCDQSRDNCRFDNSDVFSRFKCTGSCRCYIGVDFNSPIPPLQFETIDGNWHNF